MAEAQLPARKQAGELAKLQDFFPPGARDVTASPLGRASRTPPVPCSKGSYAEPLRRIPNAPPFDAQAGERTPSSGPKASRSISPAPSGISWDDDMPSLPQLGEWKRQLQQIVEAYEANSEPSTATMVSAIYEEILLDLMQEVAFETQSSARVGNGPGALMVRKWSDTLSSARGVLKVPGMDIFGQNPPKVPSTVLMCDNCNSKIAASRFAQHLAKCMGFGGRQGGRRDSSRRAAAKLQQIVSDEAAHSRSEEVVEPKIDERASLLDATMDLNDIAFDIGSLDGVAEEAEEEDDDDDDDDDDFNPTARSKKLRALNQTTKGKSNSIKRNGAEGLGGLQKKRKRKTAAESQDDLLAELLPDGFF